MVARDACAMTTHRILYEGPSSLAVPTATMLADSEGVELTSSQTREHRKDRGDMAGKGTGGGSTVVLAFTVAGTTESVRDAVAVIQDDLPAGATISIEDAADEGD